MDPEIDDSRMIAVWLRDAKGTQIKVVLASGVTITGQFARNPAPGMIVLEDADGCEALIRESDIVVIQEPEYGLMDEHG